MKREHDRRTLGDVENKSPLEHNKNTMSLSVSRKMDHNKKEKADQAKINPAPGQVICHEGV